MNFEEIYNRNMSHIKGQWPVIYQNILNADISEYELLVEKDEQLNISVNGHKIYPENINEAIKEQVNAFVNAPTSYFRKPSWCDDSRLELVHDRFIEAFANLYNDIYHSLENFKNKKPYVSKYVYSFEHAKNGIAFLYNASLSNKNKEWINN